MTLLEVLVSLGVLVMISLLIYGAFDSMSRGRRGETMRNDRSRQGREAVARMTREISSAFVSLHLPMNQALWTHRSAFMGQNGASYDRLDFASFAHRRIARDAKESDQAEIGYFVVPDPDVDGKMDLVRRHQVPMDMDPKRGGIVNVIAEDVEEFDLKYLDPMTNTWLDSWDTTQGTGQFNRLPLAVRITLVIKGIRDLPPYRYVTKVMMPMQAPLNFGIAR
jgi:general secretion pathway protein J